MVISADDHRPPYQQIADDLRELIATGELAAGSRLPSTRELMDRYDVANNTAQSAIRVLRDQGLVETVPARGTFVVNDPDLEALRNDEGGGTPLYQIVIERLDGIDEALESIRDRLTDVEQRQTQADER